MKKSLLALMVLGCGALFAAEEAETLNLLKNGGCEEWKTVDKAPGGITLKDNLIVDFGRSGGFHNENWKNGTAKIERDETVKHGGKYSIKITNTDPKNIIVVNQYDIPVEGKTKYRFSCWVKGQGLVDRQGAGIYGGFSAGNKKDFWGNNRGIITTKPWSGDFDWQKFEVVVTTRDTDEQAMAQIQLRNRCGTLWVDDLMLEEIE